MAALEPEASACVDDVITSEGDRVDAQKIAHLTDMASVLSTFRTNDSFCDVTIRLGNRTYRAHRVILASTSRMFRTMFTAGYRESTEQEVTLEETPDLDAQRFATLLNFMYTGELKLTLETVSKILATASYLQITHAIQACADYINRAFEKNHLTFDFCLELASMTSCREIDVVSAIANRFLASKFSVMCREESFLQNVSGQNMLDLLNRDDLDVANESQVLDVLVSWLKHDWDRRQVFAMNLLGRIRLGLVPPEKIVEIFETQLQEIAECRTLYLDIMKYHSLGRKSFVSSVLSDKQGSFEKPPRKTTTQKKKLTAIGTHSYHFEEDGDGLSRSEIPTVPMVNSKPTTERSLLAVNEKIYCAGGIVAKSRYLNVERHWIGKETGHLCEYSKEQRRWVSLKSMEYGRANVGLVYLDGYIYAFGGITVNQEKGDRTCTGVAERYDISGNKWQKLPRLPVILNSNTSISTSVATFQQRILVAGHRFELRSGYKANYKVLMSYDTVRNVWDTIHNTSTSNGECHVYPKDGYVYLISFQTVASKYRASSHRGTSPTVYKYSYQPSQRYLKGGETIPQTCIPETTMRVFRIGKEVYIIVRGYVYKTRVTIDDGQVFDADLSDYSCLESVDNESYAVTMY